MTSTQNHTRSCAKRGIRVVGGGTGVLSPIYSLHNSRSLTFNQIGTDIAPQYQHSLTIN